VRGGSRTAGEPGGQVKPRPRAWAALGVLALAGCGYTLAGKSGRIDPSIRRLGVPLFKDQTGKAGLDARVTQGVISELVKRGHVQIVQETSGVDALLEGTLLSYNVIPVGFSQSAQGGTQPTRYAVVLTARIRYAKPGVPEAIWENDAFSFKDEYDVGADSSSFFDREDQSIDRLVKQFSRSLVASMLEAF